MFELPHKRSRAHHNRAHVPRDFVRPTDIFGQPPPPPVTDSLPPPPDTDTLAPPPPATDTPLPPLTLTTLVTVAPSPTTPTPPPPPATTQTPPPPPPPPASSTTTNAPPPPATPTSVASSDTPPPVVNTQQQQSSLTTSSTPGAVVPTGTTPATTPTSPTAPAPTVTPTNKKGAGGSTTPALLGTSTIVHTKTATPLANHATASSALPSASIAPSGSTSKGELAGGIAAAVVACAGILFAVVWCLRKCRGRQDAFDADDFRRKSMVVPDEPSAWQRPSAGEGGPRPPTMLERAPAAPSVAHGGWAPPFAPHAGAAPWGAQQYAGPEYADPQAYGGPQYHDPQAYGPPYGGVHQPHMSGYSTASFSPGDVVFSSPQSPPATAMAAQPVFFVPRASGVGEPTVGESMPGTPTGAGPAGLLVRNPSERGRSEYVDLDRSSVTPFQARQYSEIHARLDELAAPPPLPQKQQPQPAASPFADPVLPAYDGPQHGYALDVKHAPQEPQHDEDEAQHEVSLDEHEFAAPAPAFASERVTSMPPTLPELVPRAFSPVTLDAGEYNFTMHAELALAPAPDAFPTTPLPPVTPGREAFAPQQQQRRPETVYDTEDAYDGI